jgi:hypothetical protein
MNLGRESKRPHVKCPIASPAQIVASSRSALQSLDLFRLKKLAFHNKISFFVLANEFRPTLMLVR